MTIITLDTAAETRVLTDVEHIELETSCENPTKLLREQEISYYQHSKVSDVLLGDNNTRYFQMVANVKHRKERIFCLDNENNKIEGQENLKKYITQFYKELFGPPEENSFSPDKNRINDVPQVGLDENEFLRLIS